jgi:hypothetical protein
MQLVQNIKQKSMPRNAMILFAAITIGTVVATDVLAAGRRGGGGQGRDTEQKPSNAGVRPRRRPRRSSPGLASKAMSPSPVAEVSLYNGSSEERETPWNLQRWAIQVSWFRNSASEP